MTRIISFFTVAFAYSSLFSAPTHEETVFGTSEDSTTVTSGTVQGGTNQLYVAAISMKSPEVVSSVSGLGLTWTKKIQQCSGRDQVGTAIFTAFGSPASGTVEATIDAAPSSTVIGVSRYSGADSATPTEDVVGENTNGEGGACSGGTDNDTPSLTTTSTQDDAVHYVALQIRNRSVTVDDSDYTDRGDQSAGSGGAEAHLFIRDNSVATATTDTYDATLNSDTDWVTAGLVIRPAQAAVFKPRVILLGDGAGTKNFPEPLLTFLATAN